MSLDTKRHTLTSHPVDNLLRRPLCYRLHGFFSATQQIRTIKELMRIKRRYLYSFPPVLVGNVSHSRPEPGACPPVCAHPLNSFTLAWPEAELKSPTAPHSPVCSRCCVHGRLGTQGNVTIAEQRPGSRSHGIIYLSKVQINERNTIIPTIPSQQLFLIHFSKDRFLIMFCLF